MRKKVLNLKTIKKALFRPIFTITTFRIKSFFRELDLSIELIACILYLLLVVFLKRYIKPLDNLTTYIAILGVFTAATVWLRNFFELRPRVEVKLIDRIPFDHPNSPWGLQFPLYTFDTLDNLLIFIPFAIINRSKNNNCIFEEIYTFKMKPDYIAIAITRADFASRNLIGLLNDDINKNFQELRLPLIVQSFSASQHAVTLKIRRELINEFFSKEELETIEDFQIELWLIFRSLKGKQNFIRKKINIKHKFNNNYKRV